MSTLLTKANEILAEKTTKITAGNIKSGVTIFDVTGTYTSDATANENQIAESYSAYAAGQKIQGRLTDFRGASEVPMRESGSFIADNEHSLLGVKTWIGNSSTPGMILAHDTSIACSLPYSDIASAIELSASQIKRGETVLGVTGTYSGGGAASIGVDDPYHKQLVINCTVLAASLQAYVTEHSEVANYIVTAKGDSATATVLNIGDFAQTGKYWTNDSCAPRLSIGINATDQRTYLLMDRCIATALSSTPMSTLDSSSSSSYYKATILVSDVIGLLNHIGTVNISVSEPLLLYNLFDYITLRARDSSSSPKNCVVPVTGSYISVIDKE